MRTWLLRALTALSLAACTPVTIVVPTATPPAPASPTMSPTMSPSPTVARSHLVDCGEVAVDDCAVLVASATRNGIGSVMRVTVERFVPACIRARLCLPGWGGYEASHLVTARLADGTSTGWLCTLDGDAATCGIAPREEVEPLATLVVRVVGTPRQTIILGHEGGSWGWSASEAGTEHLLTVGDWSLMTISRPCDGCLRISPPTPEEWPLAERCTSSFEARPAGKIEATIRIEAGTRCRIEITPG